MIQCLIMIIVISVISCLIIILLVYFELRSCIHQLVGFVCFSPKLSFPGMVSMTPLSFTNNFQLPMIFSAVFP